MVKKVSHLWIIVGLLLVVWGFLLYRVDAKLFGHHDASIVWMSAAVRNMNDFGAAAVDYLPLRMPEPTTPDNPDNYYYLHHPPTIIWIDAIASQLFGVNDPIPSPKEISMRMVAYIATMLSLPLLYVVVRRLLNENAALIALFLYAATPITLYFGRQPHYDILMMPLALLYIAIFISWMRKYSFSKSVMLFVVAAAMMWLDWPGVFYLAPLGVYALIFGNNKHRIAMIAIGVLTMIATGLIFVMYEILRPGTFTDDIMEIVELRTSTSSDGYTSPSFTISDYFKRQVQHFFTSASIAISIFGIIGIVRLLVSKKDRNIYLLLTVILIPILFMAIVRNSFYIHDWYKIHFMPGLTAAAGALIWAGWNTEPDTIIKRYIKPFIVAICVSSVGVTGYWLVSLHLTSINNVFERDLAEQLAMQTEVDDLIATNFDQLRTMVEYYAYRDVLWGVSQEAALEFIEEQEPGTVDLYYMICVEEETVDTYDGIFSEYEYTVIGGRCRLIHIVQ